MDGDAALVMCEGDESQAAGLLDALCLSWFGPIFRYPGSPPRSDRGGSHATPERRWLCLCEWCDGQLFSASRPDARYCSNRCRQAAYRSRRQAGES
jgi:hypothetical protein